MTAQQPQPQPLTVERFRETFPSFTSDLYPDSSVSVRLKLADRFFSDPVWTEDLEVRDHVMGLYTAHCLEAAGSKASGGSGGGDGAGIVSSKSVDGASVSYDTTTGAWDDAGFWNLTPWGRELWYLMSVYGAGAIQL